MAETELKIRAIAEGTQQTAQSLEQVAAAQRDVNAAVAESAGEASDATKAQAKAVDAQGEAARKAQASTASWSHVLNRAVPGLGQVVQLGAHLVKVFKEIAPSGDGAADGTSKVGSALKVLGGIGGVAILSAITVALQAMAQAAREAQEQLRKTSQAMTDLQAQRRGLEQSIEDIAVQRKQVGPLSADQATAAANLATKITEQYPDADRGTVARAVGTYSGTGATDEEITRAVFLLRRGEFQPKEDASAASLVGHLRRGLSSQGGFIDRDIATQQEQKAQRDAQVRQQAQQQGGGVIDLRAQVEKFAQAGVDINKVVDILQEGQSTAGVKEIRNQTDLGAFNTNFSWEAFHEAFLRAASQAGRAAGFDFGGTRSATQSEVATALAAAPAVFNDLRPAIEAHTRALQDNTTEMRNLKRRSPESHNYFTGPVSVQGSGPVSNGQTHADSIGE